jgi:hypothetical protein
VVRTTVIDRRYPANVFWSEEDEGFIALAPDLPGCTAFGASQAEALDELKQEGPQEILFPSRHRYRGRP